MIRLTRENLIFLYLDRKLVRGVVLTLVRGMVRKLKGPQNHQNWCTEWC